MAQLPQRDFSNFLLIYGKIKAINAPRKRLFDLPDPREGLELLQIKDMRISKDQYDPERKDVLYSISTVQRAFGASGPFGHLNFEISPITGEPRLKQVLEYVYREHGFIPLESLFDQVERFFMFRDAFLGRNAQGRLGIPQYLRNLRDFWDFARGEFTSSTNPNGKVSDWPALTWEVHSKVMTLIHKDQVRMGLLGLGPTMNISLARKKAILRTKSGFEEILKTAAETWFQQLNPQFEEGRPD
jgi:hypothetical protein